MPALARWGQALTDSIWQTLDVKGLPVFSPHNADWNGARTSGVVSPAPRFGGMAYFFALRGSSAGFT